MKRVREVANRVGEAYAGDEPRPLRGYLVAMGTYSGLVAGLLGGLWTATALTAGMVFAPRLTRLANTVLTAVAVFDTLHIGYDGAKQLLHQLGDEGGAGR